MYTIGTVKREREEQTMSVFSILLTANETGTNRLVINEVVGVYETREKAIQVIYDMADGNEVEREGNRFEWFSNLEEEGEYYTVVAFVQEHILC